MTMNMEQVIEEIDSLISEGNNVLKTKWSPSDMGVISFSTLVNNDVYSAWRIKVYNFLQMMLGIDSAYLSQLQQLTENDYSNASQINKILEDIKDYLKKGIIAINTSKVVPAEDILQTLLQGFHKFVRQLRTRHEGRETLIVSDEYDVQDLLHALLRIFFNDVRPEEWTPSYAGGAARMDFLLKNEKIVIEVKKTRHSMTAKDLGDQLIIDIDRYHIHPDCRLLYCFVYDPEGFLGNPQGIVSDLESEHNGFTKVVICPD